MKYVIIILSAMMLLIAIPLWPQSSTPEIGDVVIANRSRQSITTHAVLASDRSGLLGYRTDELQAGQTVVLSRSVANTIYMSLSRQVPIAITRGQVVYVPTPGLHLAGKAPYTWPADILRYYSAPHFFEQPQDSWRLVAELNRRKPEQQSLYLAVTGRKIEVKVRQITVVLVQESDICVNYITAWNEANKKVRSQTVVNIDFSGEFNRDIIVNNGGADNTGYVAQGISGDSVQDWTDPDNYLLMTQSVATAHNDGPVGSRDGLPDNGVIPANQAHPQVTLGYNNNNDGNNVAILEPRAQVDLDVPVQRYSQLAFFATCFDAATVVTTVITYDDDSTKTADVTVPEWKESIVENNDQYYLIDNLDSLDGQSPSKTRDLGDYQDLNQLAIFGFNLHPDTSKQVKHLQIIYTPVIPPESKQKRVKNGSSGVPVIFGAIGILEPEIDVKGNGVSIANGDITPDSADHTDFGTVQIGSNVVRTFTIASLGTGNLTLIGNPTAQITGANAGDFSVTQFPTTPIATGNTTTFQITFQPTAAGVRRATIEIPNDDSDEAPYSFAIMGTALSNVVEVPDIVVAGNNRDIPNNDNTPDFADNTIFVNTVAAGVFVGTFTITNPGTSDLILSGDSPYVTIEQSGTGVFMVGVVPKKVIEPGKTTVFQVQFLAPTPGQFDAIINIANNVPDKSPYRFNIRAYAFAVTGTLPALPSGDDDDDCSSGLTGIEILLLFVTIRLVRTWRDRQ